MLDGVLALAVVKLCTSSIQVDYGGDRNTWSRHSLESRSPSYNEKKSPGCG